MSVAEPRNLIEVLSRMEYWRQEPAVEHNRSFRRFGARGEATIEPVEPAAEPHIESVMLRDIARGGIGFLCSSFLEPGTILRIGFQHHGRRIATQVACVRFCRLVQDGLYLAGAQFIIEPYLMLALGVSESDLADDVLDTKAPLDTAEFVPPDDVES